MLNYKEFYFWLEGYLTGNLENKSIEIAPIIEKMSLVKEDKKSNLLTEITIPKAPVFNTSVNSTYGIDTTTKNEAIS